MNWQLIKKYLDFQDSDAENTGTPPLSSTYSSTSVQQTVFKRFNADDHLDTKQSGNNSQDLEGSSGAEILFGDALTEVMGTTHDQKKNKLLPYLQICVKLFNLFLGLEI